MREKFAPRLPDAVARQKAEVESMVRGVAPDGAPPAPAGGQEAEGPAPVPDVQAPAGAEDAGVQPTPNTPAESSAPATPTDSKTDSKDNIESLKRQLREAEQEARTWKGRHTKTVEEQKALADRVADLEARLTAASEAQEPALKEVSADEIEAYGSDLLEVAKRYVLPAARAEFEKAMRPILTRLDALESGVKGVQAKEAKSDWDQFCDRITAVLPNWREIDTTDAFGAWLDSIDPFFDEPRRRALDSAVAKLDSARVIKVFQAYLDQTGQSPGGSRGAQTGRDSRTGTESAASATTAQTEPETPQPSLEDLAAPGKPASSPSGPLPVQPGAKVWLQSEIDAYYRARRQSSHPHFHNREAGLAMDREIAQAQRDGRVRLG